MRDNSLAPTAEDSVGPYYPPAFMDVDRQDLTRWDGLSVRPEGEFVILTGTIFDVEGRPVKPVLVESWQADASGRYPTGPGEGPAWFEGLSRQISRDGRYRLVTVRPGSGDGRAPHVTLNIFCDGINRLVTQIFLEAKDDDALLASLPADLRARLIAAHAGEEGGMPVYHRDIVLRGEGETPFFDDLED